MATSKQAEKRVRQNEKRRLRNKATRTAMKTCVKKVLQALERGDGENAKQLLPEAMKRIDKAAKKRVLHPNQAARKKSRLSRMVHALTAAGQG